MTGRKGATSALLVLILVALAPTAIRAQQLEPRAYSPAPIGANFAGVGAVYSSGGVVTDASAPVDNINAEVISAAAFYGQTFGVAGRLANASVAVPYAWATVEGDVQDVTRSVDRSGFGDAQLRLAMNLIGGPALSPEEFARREPKTTLGTSLTVVVPVGQYDPSKLINLGTNRWAYKPELGLSHPVGKWIFEVYAGLWLFQTNDNYFGGQVREQHSLASYQAHVVYTFRPNTWLAADYTYYSGGSTVINGLPKYDRQGNSRGGLTLALPVPTLKGQSVKISLTRGVSTRIGSSFDTVAVNWQWLWF